MKEGRSESALGCDTSILQVPCDTKVTLKVTWILNPTSVYIKVYLKHIYFIIVSRQTNHEVFSIL